MGINYHKLKMIGQGRSYKYTSIKMENMNPFTRLTVFFKNVVDNDIKMIKKIFAMIQQRASTLSAYYWSDPVSISLSAIMLWICRELVSAGLFLNSLLNVT